MLEFLENYNQYHIYDRAKDIEIKIRSFDPISSMETFLEVILKAFYIELYDEVAEENVKGINLYNLIDDAKFTRDILEKTKLTDDDLDFADNYIRRKGNFYKHDLNLITVRDNYVEDCFRCIYKFATEYYHFVSGQNAPDWSDEGYKTLIKNSLSNSDRTAIEDELTEQVENLERRIRSTEAERNEARRGIEELQNQLDDVLRKNATGNEVKQLQENVSILEARIDELSGQSVILKENERDALQAKARAEEELEKIKRENKLSDEIASRKSEKKIEKLTARIEASEKRSEELASKNDNLQKQLIQLNVEKVGLQKKLAEKEKLSSDINVVVNLEGKLAAEKAKRAAAEESLEEMQRNLENLKSQLYVSNTELEKISRQYQENTQIVENIHHALEEAGPRCPQCNSILKLNPSKFDDGYYWSCPGYWQGCTAKTRKLTNEEKKLVARITEITGDLPKTTLYKASPEILGKYKKKKLDFAPYPQLYGRHDPISYLFQTICVPNEVFNKRSENMVNLFSKFRMITNLDTFHVPDEERTIYSLALRILNRGIVLPQYEPTEIALRERFNKNDFGAINNLFDYIKYENPYNPYSSDREKKFAEYYFPKLIGDNWATYVFAQALISDLADDDGQFTGQRVDFLIFKNGRKIIIELDGPEHLKQLELDQARDDFLQKNGYHVLRFKNSDVDNRNQTVLEQLKDIFGEEKHNRIDAEVDNRFLVASKMCHQIAIAIVKGLEKGFIPADSSIRITASTEMFTQSEISYILTVAIAEVYALLKSFANIYDVEQKWDFLSNSGPIINIFIGDGMLNSGKGIMIRDCALPINYLCEIEEFSEKITPKNIGLADTEFFLKYIFGYEHFRSGQFNAIKRLLLKKDTIVLLPTGSGKSIVYQLSSFMVPGMIVVISPLISLIEDQVDNLNINNGINNAIYFASNMGKTGILKKSESRRLMQHNSTSLMYLAPERLMIPTFRTDVAGMMQHNCVFAVAIDEAHCVSEWGHDFRPAYLNVGNAARRLFRKNGTTPVLTALTGTASDAVLNDVRLDLGIRGYDALVQPETFDRNELHFSIVSCPADAKDYQIANIIKKELPHKFNMPYDVFTKLDGENTEAGIVFTPLAQKKNSMYSAIELNQKLSGALPELGIASYFSSVPKNYDEDTWKETIRENAKRFKGNELNLLVATKAFGMGIDKPNVHFIIHDGLPTSFEQYYQEAGRAGRDRGFSQCVLVFSNDNEEDNKFFLNPNLSIGEFKEKYAQYSDRVYQESSEDDVSALLYFHDGAFKGIEQETKKIAEILDIINSNSFEEGKTIKIAMPTDNLEKDKNGNPTKAAINQEEKTWIQSFTRLVILGVISDYTYDYRQNFTVSCGSLKKNSISAHYMDYVSGNSKGREKKEGEKLNNCEYTGVELAKWAVKLLIEYIYDSIEKSRRRAMTEMWSAAKEASSYTGDEQDRFIRNRIVSYFTYSGENRDNLKAIENGNYAGLTEVLKTFSLGPEEVTYSNEDKERFKELSVLAGRILESRPDHPGLLLAQALSNIITTGVIDSLDMNNITSAFAFAKDRYSIEDSVYETVLFSTMNFILNLSEEKFDVLFAQMFADSSNGNINLYKNMALSNAFSDNNREYLISCYTMGKYRLFTSRRN